jgi:hypothetical protein
MDDWNLDEKKCNEQPYLHTYKSIMPNVFFTMNDKLMLGLYFSVDDTTHAVCN